MPICCGRRIAGPVKLVGEARPLVGCKVGTAAQVVGPAPTLHGALGGRQASAANIQYIIVNIMLWPRVRILKVTILLRVYTWFWTL